MLNGKHTNRLIFGANDDEARSKCFSALRTNGINVDIGSKLWPLRLLMEELSKTRLVALVQQLPQYVNVAECRVAVCTRGCEQNKLASRLLLKRERVVRSDAAVMRLGGACRSL